MGFYILKGSARLVSGNNAIVARPVIMLLAMLRRGVRQARKCREKLGESLSDSKKKRITTLGQGFCYMKNILCSLSVATSFNPPEQAPRAVNNRCFTPLKEQGEDNVLCWDNALPYFCRFPLMHETNGTGALPWSHLNEGVCHEVKWRRRRRQKGECGVGGWQVPQKSGSGCSTLAVHHGSSQVNVKTRESFAEYWFNAAALAGGRCALQITCALFPTHTEPWVPLPPHSREPETERGCSLKCSLPSVLSSHIKISPRYKSTKKKTSSTYQDLLFFT